MASNIQPCVYIMANNSRTIYIGVTSDLYARVWQHKFKAHPKAFTSVYGCDKLVHMSEFARMNDAIAFEKFLKGKKREHKVALIEKTNPRWNDLAWNWY